MFLVLVEESAGGLHIALGKGTNALDLGSIGKAVELLEARDSHVLLQTRELDLDKLFRVEGAVVVAVRGHGLGNKHTRSVGSLPNVLLVHATSDLLDEQRSQTHGAELLVDAEEVDLDHLVVFTVSNDVGRDGSDEAYEGLGGVGGAHRHMPLL